MFAPNGVSFVPPYSMSEHEHTTTFACVVVAAADLAMDNRRNRRPMPTFNDKFSVRDRLPPDMFGDARRQLHDDVWGRADLDWPTRGFGGRLGSLGRHFGADVDNLRRRFHDLKPRAPTVAEFGSCDSLDEDSARSLILEDSHSKSRTFEVTTLRHLANASATSCSLSESTSCSPFHRGVFRGTGIGPCPFEFHFRFVSHITCSATAWQHGN